jgi:hypothetical protein
MVVRQLRQDVLAFRDFLAAEAGRLSAEPGFAGLDAEALGARLVGRWKGGGPLVRFPDGEQIPANRFEFNHFGFAEVARPMAAREGEEETEVAGAPADPDGLRCPMSAHIRKVNPRDATTDRGGGPETLLTMVLRRGIPYGAPLPEGAASPEADPEAGRRGLMFVCYQASIVDQFEVLNSRWMNREFVPESGAGHDLIVGQNNRPGEGNERRCPLRSAGAADERRRCGPSPIGACRRGAGTSSSPRSRPCASPANQERRGMPPTADLGAARGRSAARTDRMGKDRAWRSSTR